MKIALHLSFGIALAATTLSALAGASSASSDIPVLSRSPACAFDRLGSVSVTAGTKDDPGASRAPHGVSYQSAFDKLAAAASRLGGSAVILRNHEANYFSRGAGHDKRPIYIELQGDAIRMVASASPCQMEIIDPVAFGRHSENAQKVEVNKYNDNY
jgi:hypothetical protein